MASHHDRIFFLSRRWALILAAVSVSFTMALPARASLPVLITSFSGGTQLGSSCGSGGNTIGWQFVVGANNLQIDALGEYAAYDPNGLTMDVQVGVWDSVGALIAMVTVPSGGGTTK